MEQGFEEANNSNLPEVNAFIVFRYFQSNPDFQDPEVHNIKTASAGRDSYGDNAIGYVQLKHTNNVCIVKATITPEHRVRNKPYKVTAHIDEEKKIIQMCKCLDCPASEGGCKHMVAFLMWLNRRSEEPSVTSVQSYWKVSKLSRVGRSIEYSTLNTLCKKPPPNIIEPADDFLHEVLEEGKKRRAGGLIFQETEEGDEISVLSIHQLALKFKSRYPNAKSAQEFINYMKSNIRDEDCKTVEKVTQGQSREPKWFEVRYGRITASKLYEASHCKTLDGSLTTTILGSAKMIQTEAVQRGENLEKSVLEAVKKAYELKLQKNGFFIAKHCPIFGASPDGLTKTHVIEIKCPFQDSTVKNYVDDDGNVLSKPLIQMQLQMYLSGRSKGYFVVAHPTFERTKQFQVIEVDFNKTLLLEHMKNAENFWKTAIFPHLLK